MLHVLATLDARLLDGGLGAIGLLAQGGKNYSYSWAIVLFFVILGLLVTLSPSRRTYEIKKPKDE